MEKKMKSGKSSKKIISFLTLAVPLAGGLLSNFLIFSFIPLIGGVIAVFGQRYNKISYINIGMAMAIVSFYFLNFNLSFTIVNLVLMLSFFISMMIIWAFARHNLVTAEIKKDMNIEWKNRYLKEYQIKSTSSIVKKMIFALLLSFGGSFIALSSYTQVFLIPAAAVPLTIAFSAVVLGVIYILIVYLPKYLEEQYSEAE